MIDARQVSKEHGIVDFSEWNCGSMLDEAKDTIEKLAKLTAREFLLEVFETCTVSIDAPHAETSSRLAVDGFSVCARFVVAQDKMALFEVSIPGLVDDFVECYGAGGRKTEQTEGLANCLRDMAARLESLPEVAA